MQTLELEMGQIETNRGYDPRSTSVIIKLYQLGPTMRSLSLQSLQFDRHLYLGLKVLE